MEFRVLLYKLMLNWKTRVSAYILEEVLDVIKMYEGSIDKYQPVLEILIEKTTFFLDSTKKVDCYQDIKFEMLCQNLRKQIIKIISYNQHVFWITEFRAKLQSKQQSP